MEMYQDKTVNTFLYDDQYHKSIYSDKTTLDVIS